MILGEGTKGTQVCVIQRMMEEETEEENGKDHSYL